MAEELTIGQRLDLTFANLATKADVQAVKEDVAALQADMTVVKGDVQALQTDMTVVKGDVQGLKGDVRRLEGLMIGLIDAVNANTAETGRALAQAGIPVKFVKAAKTVP